MPTATLLAGDDVDHSAQRVGAEAHGHYALVHLDAFGKVDGQVVQVEGLSGSLLGHAVDEHFDVFAAEAVEHELHVRSYAAALAQLHARCLGQDIAQVLGRVLHLGGIDGHGIVGRTLHARYAVGGHGHLVKLVGERFEAYVQFQPPVGFKAYTAFHVLVADGRDHQCVVACRCFDVVEALVVGDAAQGGTLELHGGVVHHASLGRDDTPRQQGVASPVVAVLGVQGQAQQRQQGQQGENGCLSYMFHNVRINVG